MQTVIIVIHLMVVATLIGVVLLQRSEGGGLGIGGGGGFLTSRGTANVLTRTTAILAAVFFTTSIALTLIAGWERKPRSILGTPSAPTAPGPPPASSGGGGVLDKLRGGAPQPQAPSAPQPPPGPQVPQSQ
jgi:preprotein translocase subunit SecG